MLGPMPQPGAAESSFTFTLSGLSVDEIDELTVLLHRHSTRVEDDTHRDVGALVHTITVFVQQHGDAIKNGAVLATALIGWLREWRKRVAAEKAVRDAATRPDIQIVRAGDPRLSPLSVRDATDDQVRAILGGGPGPR